MNLIRNGLQYYKNSFNGFSKEVWWLAFATLINRAGAMVLPFLSLYLTNALDFTLENVGWIMSFFGLGSLVGSWIGGEMAHKFGAYRTMIFSLVFSGVSLIILGHFNDFAWICGGIFTVAMISDIFRPAVFVSLASYAKPENRTRAVTLIRLAINLGFSLGPAVGGLIIVSTGYISLFWIDGFTCVFAGLTILLGIKEKIIKVSSNEKDTRHSHGKILSDKTYLFFLVAMFLFSVLFVQYFSAMPVYYKGVRALTEDEVGWLLSMNGFLIFLIEMPVIYALDNPKYSKFSIMLIGSLLLASSYAVLFIQNWSGVLIIGMILATFAEMLCFPFTNSYAMQRGGAGNEGRYMAYYSMTFSLAHIIGHNFGMQVSGNYGFRTLFVIMTILAVLSGVLFWTVGRVENSNKHTR
ncbi:MAG: MFS transporter [Cyclobacteriaceae bacterium]|nr:MFS transporter [Cyclobacteriaceae bacterium]